MPNGSTGDALASAARTLRAKAIRRRALKRVSDLLSSPDYVDAFVRKAVREIVAPQKLALDALDRAMRSTFR